MTSGADPPVVVGVDGSDQARAAARLAAGEAARRRRPLRVVHAFVWPLPPTLLDPSPVRPPEGTLREEAERIVSDAVADAQGAQPGVPTTGAVVTGAPPAVLLNEARDAALVVVGDRGRGGFVGLLLGSVAVQVAAHAPCPVLVRRGAERTDGPVLVGVDGSATSDLAIGFAMEEASCRSTNLVAVHAWAPPMPIGPVDLQPLVYDVAEVTATETQVLDESLSGWRDRYPAVAVEERVVRGQPAQVLLSESADAQLIVEGARGLGGFTGLLLGSVSQAMLHHAPCPVAIVRRQEEAETG